MAHAFLNAERPALVPMSTCSKKVFDSRRMAFWALKNMTSKQELAATGAGPMNAYRCEQCVGWHVGHKPRRTARRKA